MFAKTTGVSGKIYGDLTSPHPYPAPPLANNFLEKY
jgi:hypothetical protein